MARGTALLVLVAPGASCERAESGGVEPRVAQAMPPAERKPRPARGEAHDAQAPPPDFEGNWYVVDPGQSLAELARAHGLDPAKAEALSQPIDRAWFETLRRAIAEHFPDIEEAWGGRIRLPRWGFSHVVEEGEDIWSLSRRFDVSALELLIVNGWREGDAERIEMGQRILIPGVIRHPDGRFAHVDTAWPKKARQRAEALGLGSRATAGALLRGALKDAWVRTAGGTVGAGTFNWPVVGGWLVRGFGTGEEGYHKAIDIGGRIGWPARAVDDGIVAYAGDALRGYGNVVMLVHAGGFASFYAHLSRSFVNAGERVRRAEIIAEIGSTGISRGPHLHFELIHDRVNCDPEPLFRPGVRRHDGDLLDVPKRRWDGTGSPPSGVRCEKRPSHHPDSRWVENEDPAADAEPRSGLRP